MVNTSSHLHLCGIKLGLMQVHLSNQFASNLKIDMLPIETISLFYTLRCDPQNIIEHPERT